MPLGIVAAEDQKRATALLDEALEVPGRRLVRPCQRLRAHDQTTAWGLDSAEELPGGRPRRHAHPVGELQEALLRRGQGLARRKNQLPHPVLRMSARNLLICSFRRKRMTSAGKTRSTPVTRAEK